MSCKKIDDIFSSLKELENKGYLRVAPENHQIQTLKFELWYMRMHLKWHTTLYYPLLCNMRTWVDDVEMCLLQSTRQGSMTSKVFGGKFYNLLLIMKVGKAILRKQCSLYYEDEQYGFNLSCKCVQIEELLLECIDPLLESLKHLVQCNDLNLLVFPKEQIEAIAEKLRSLKKFLEITGTEVHDVLKNVTPNQGLLNKKLDLLSRIKRLIENAVYAFCYSWAKGKETRIEKLFFDMKVKMDHIEPEVRLTYVQLLKSSKIPNPGSLGIDLQALAAVDTLLDNLQTRPKEQDTIGSTDPLDVQRIEFLQKELSLLKYFLLSPKLKQYFETEPRSFNSLLMQVEVLVGGAASHTHSIYYGCKKDEMNVQYSNLVKILDLFKAKMKEIYDGVSKPSIPNFPQIPKFGFLEFFLQKLDELLNHKADSIIYVKKGIEVVQTELGHLMYFTSETIKKPKEEKWFSMDKEEKKKEKFVQLILKVAYEAEHVIDSISTSNIPHWYHMLWLSDVVEKIQELRKDSIEVFGENTWDSNLLNVEKDSSSTQDDPLAYNLTTEEVVVGFEDQVELIIHHLVGGTEHLDIVSIVGMPGLGKTTLARKVYEHTLVTRYFDLRSWYCISQAYDRRDLLLGILADVTELSEEIGEMDDKDLAEALHKSLQQKRYLIVLDDIWSIHPWDDIRNLFPDDSKGSRILFTSRMQDLGFRANPTCVIHHLRFLTSYESWELLENKIFNRRSCPPELYAIGNDIVEKCEGLPLSLVLIAGVLRLEETKEHWIQVLESIGRRKSGDSTDALNLSYKYLPDSLKPCFLYLGAFPEDKEIPTWKLLCLWIAEGLVRPKKSNMSLENVAEGYLMDLIARGLLLLGQNKSSGGVKSCRVHDVLREFSSMKANEENFLVISHEMVNLQQYRHFFYCKHFLGDMPSDSYIRSLIFFPTEKKSLSLISNIFCNLNAFDLSVLPYILKLLRVLDLEHIHLDSAKFPADIELLVHLRYLAVQGRLKHVPSSVANIWRLQTFRVVGTGGQVMLPETLLGMAYLKHLYVSNEATFELSDTFELENSSGSDGIEKLSTISLRHGDCTTQKILRSLRSARKLKCIFLESPDCSVSCSTFPALNLLNKLESLNLTYQGNVKVQHPCDLTFPSNLKKVTLSNFCLPWSEISKLGRLPQLKVLKLLFRAFEGRVWDLGDEKFGNLKFLKLESLDMVKWNASPFAFPCLEQIVLKKCWRLQELPSSFGELATLKIIQVQWCSDSVIQSVNKIQEKKQDLQGGDELKVLIQ